MNMILDSYNSLKDKPNGKKEFSDMVCMITPYFKSIDPEVIDLKSGYGKWSMKKTKSVENHLSTVHAIAMCNLCEITAGLTIEVTLPTNKRWIPMGMDVQYLKKAKTDLYAECTIDNVDWNSLDAYTTDVNVYDTNGDIVVSAKIKMKIGDK